MDHLGGTTLIIKIQFLYLHQSGRTKCTKAKYIDIRAHKPIVESDELYGEVETQFLLFGLLLHTQPLNSSKQHTKADFD